MTAKALPLDNMKYIQIICSKGGGPRAKKTKQATVDDELPIKKYKHALEHLRSVGVSLSGWCRVFGTLTASDSKLLPQNWNTQMVATPHQLNRE